MLISLQQDDNDIQFDRVEKKSIFKFENSDKQLTSNNDLIVLK